MLVDGLALKRRERRAPRHERCGIDLRGWKDCRMLAVCHCCALSAFQTGIVALRNLGQHALQNYQAVLVE
jgi:hypothetical protein